MPGETIYFWGRRISEEEFMRLGKRFFQIQTRGPIFANLVFGRMKSTGPPNRKHKQALLEAHGQEKSYKSPNGGQQHALPDPFFDYRYQIPI